MNRLNPSRLPLRRPTLTLMTGAITATLLSFLAHGCASEIAPDDASFSEKNAGNDDGLLVLACPPEQSGALHHAMRARHLGSNRYELNMVAWDEGTQTKSILYSMIAVWREYKATFTTNKHTIHGFLDGEKVTITSQTGNRVLWRNDVRRNEVTLGWTKYNGESLGPFTCSVNNDNWNTIMGSISTTDPMARFRE